MNSNKCEQNKIIYFLSFFMVMLALIILNIYIRNYNSATYRSISNLPSYELSRLSDNQNTKTKIMILYREGCGLCKKLESPISKTVFRERVVNSKYEIIVLDLDKMTSKQLIQINNTVHGLGSNGVFKTPTVVLIDKSTNGWKVRKKAVGSNLENIIKILEASNG